MAVLLPQSDLFFVVFWSKIQCLHFRTHELKFFCDVITSTPFWPIRTRVCCDKNAKIVNNKLNKALFSLLCSVSFLVNRKRLLYERQRHAMEKRAFLSARYRAFLAGKYETYYFVQYELAVSYYQKVGNFLSSIRKVLAFFTGKSCRFG